MPQTKRKTLSTLLNMKLLFDENISYRITRKIEEIFPESSHVNEYDLHRSDDFDIWSCAKKNNFTIVTNDSDFNEFANMYNPPPKVIWLRTENISTNDIAKLLQEKYSRIIDFSQDENQSIMVIYLTS
jgi:predicted nuclease of predicted toxin-antitoxin system